MDGEDEHYTVDFGAVGIDMMIMGGGGSERSQPFSPRVSLSLSLFFFFFFFFFFIFFVILGRGSCYFVTLSVFGGGGFLFSFLSG